MDVTHPEKISWNTTGKTKKSFTSLTITSSLLGVNFGIGIRSEDTGVDDFASTTNKATAK